MKAATFPAFSLQIEQSEAGQLIRPYLSQVSNTKEPPLQALSEPYVNLSIHTPPIVHPFFLYKTPQ